LNSNAASNPRIVPTNTTELHDRLSIAEDVIRGQDDDRRPDQNVGRRRDVLR
jgi:hypothetical protein